MRWYRSIALLGMKLPVVGFGMCSVTVPTQVAAPRSQYPLRLFAPVVAEPVGFGVHHGVRESLSDAPEQLLHVDGAIVEPGEWRACPASGLTRFP